MEETALLGGRSLEVISALVVAGIVFCVWWIRGRQKPEPSLLVGKVSKIWLHPIKSMGVLELEEALCTPMGLQILGTDICDRSILVTNSEYNFINLKQKPCLALVKPSIHGNNIHLDAPKMDTLVLKRKATEPDCTVKVFGQPKSARDCGEEASRWISKYLNQDGVRLCQSVPGPVKRFIREDPRKPYTKFFTQPQVKKDDQATFQDIGPYMVASEGSVAELNSRTDAPVTMGYFRPSIVIEGCPPFDEDYWREMKIADARFSFFMLNDSCTATQVNPCTGTKREDQEPLRTLRTFRKIEPLYGNSPVFGHFCVLDQPGTIRVGDPVYVTKV